MQTTLDIDAFFRAAPVERVFDRVLPDGVAVQFDLQGDGGGTWVVVHRDQRTAVSRAPASRPDCRLVTSTADFSALLRGELDPRRGFLEGRLRVVGDVGLVIKLHRLLARGA